MESQLQCPSILSILFTFFLFIFFVLRIWKKSRIRNPTLNLPPGPPKLPLIGNLHQLVGSLPHHRLRELANEYGPDLIHLQLGEVANFVISSPETAKEVLKTHGSIFAERYAILSAKIVAYNSTDIAFSPYGDYWRQLRKMCVLELLSAKRVQSFRSIREQEVSKLIKSISSSTVGSPINFSRLVNSLTYSVISRAAFGKVWKGEEVFITVAKKLMAALGGFSLADCYPSIKLLHVISGMRAEVENLYHQLDKLLEEIINEHRAKVNDLGAEGEDHDLVDVLLNLQEQGDLEFPLTTDNLKAIIMDLFIAGSDTSATTAEWAMSEMVKNPRVMEKAQAEVREVFGRKGNVEEAGLDDLKYLKLVIKETLRLHPPNPLISRESREACKIAGYDIPAQSKVIVNAWSIGRDPNYWTEPTRFYPDRFLDSSIDYKGNDFELIPFGAGRRICPGILFGIAIVELPLAQALYHFDWKLPNELKPAEFDMSEAFGLVVKRKTDLCLIPIPHNPLGPVD